jgi:hypothetical protein
MDVGQFSHLRRFIQQHQTAVLERELVAACRRPHLSLSGHSALDAAEALFLASVFSTFFWSLLIFTIAHRR